MSTGGLEQLENIQSTKERQVKYPSRWFRDIFNLELQVCKFQEVKRQNVKYIGPGQSSTDCASIRTDFPVPRACDFYYFEIKIVNGGTNDIVGVGLSQDDVSQDQMPGWMINSYGYHGDDGNMFAGTETGKPYGPLYTTKESAVDDVIGCYWDRRNRIAGFTKNGTHLGTAFRDIVEEEMYPTVGLRSPNAEIIANFGSSEFEADVEILKGEVEEHILKITGDQSMLFISVHFTNEYLAAPFCGFEQMVLDDSAVQEPVRKSVATASSGRATMSCGGLKISAALILFVALICPLIASEYTCDGDKYRKDCGYYGIKEDECSILGCCWDETGKEGLPFCFYKNGGYEHCLASSPREDCGEMGVTEQECYDRGCCWDPMDDEPWCFYQNANIEVKNCPYEDKEQCGDAEIKQDECEGKGCCWSVAEEGSSVPSCFKAKPQSSLKHISNKPAFDVPTIKIT